ncbi:MAG: hypothetical protein JSS07_04495 [Proteobacteria bacterium]|nr:hypothetical protein [Pseudomonadota bacterium]
MYTKLDLQNVEKALMQLMLGEKIVSFSRSTAVGTQTVTFNQTQITDLERLRAQIKRHLNRGKSDYLRITTSKGL